MRAADKLAASDVDASVAVSKGLISVARILLRDPDLLVSWTRFMAKSKQIRAISNTIIRPSHTVSLDWHESVL